MMKLAVVFLVAFAAFAQLSFASALFTSEELEAYWERFKVDYSRQYASFEEETTRKSIFTSNLEYIFRHNVDSIPHTYTVGINQFADLTNEEFRRQIVPKTVTAKLTADPVPISNLPATVDWVQKGVVTPVKNQGQLGEPWAFSATAAVESAHAIKTGSLIELSEAQLEDCCHPYGRSLNQDTLYDKVFQCILNTTGIDTAASYPSPLGQCHFNPSTRGSSVRGYVDLPSGSELLLQNAVALSGPVAVLIDASHISFQLYTGGVYDEPKCSNTELDHAVTVVGYGNLSGVDYWKVKNSWGASWGEKGYILMSRNKQNQCGIASQAAYPLV